MPKHAGFPGSVFKQKKENILKEVKESLKAIKGELDNALSEDNERLEVERATELRRWLDDELRTTINMNRSVAESALADERNRFSDKVRELCNTALSDVLADSHFLKELFKQQLVARPHLDWTIRSFDLDSLINEGETRKTITRTFNRLREGVSGFFSYIFHGFSSIRKQRVTEIIKERFVPKDAFRSECKASISSVRKLFDDVLSDEKLDEVLKLVSLQFLLEVDNFLSDASQLRKSVDLFTDKLKTTKQARAKHEAMLNRVRQLGDQLQSLLELDPVVSVAVPS